MSTQLRWSSVVAALSGGPVGLLLAWLLVTGRWLVAFVVFTAFMGFWWVRTTWTYLAWRARRRHRRATRRATERSGGVRR